MCRVNIILLLAEDIVKSHILSVIRSNHVARPKAQSHVGHQAAGGGREYGPLQMFFPRQPVKNEDSFSGNLCCHRLVLFGGEGGVAMKQQQTL